MSVYLDSAIIDEAKIALSLGYVSGITTNPLLVQKAAPANWRKHLKEICELSDGKIFYQVDVENPDDFSQASKEIFNVSPKQIIVKLPAIQPSFKAVAEIGDKIPCCITAVYSEAQALAAYESGAKYVALYVNRTSRFFKEGKGNLKHDGISLVAAIRELIERRGMKLEILAASLKTVNELMDASKAGAHHVTASLDVIKGLAVNDLSEEATKEFNTCIRNL